MRLQRVLANPRASATQIRAVASELPTVGLEDALAILLALLDREPQTFSRGAARWGARLTLERRLGRSTPSSRWPRWRCWRARALAPALRR